MIFHVVRGTLLVFALLTGGLLLVQGQPHNDSTMRDLLLPEGCAAPCVMGIRPGRTTILAALDLLRQHPWVAENTIDYQPGVHMEWGWNGQQPDFIDNTRTGRLIFNPNASLIEQVWIAVHMQEGQLHLLLGKPSFFTARVSQFRRAQTPMIANAYYTNFVKGLRVDVFQVAFECKICAHPSFIIGITSTGIFIRLPKPSARCILPTTCTRLSSG